MAAQEVSIKVAFYLLPAKAEEDAKQTGRSKHDPPLGSRKHGLPGNLTSTGRQMCQDGGTDTLPCKIPSVKAMEAWLAAGRTEEVLATMPRAEMARGKEGERKNKEK